MGGRGISPARGMYVLACVSRRVGLHEELQLSNSAEVSMGEVGMFRSREMEVTTLSSLIGRSPRVSRQSMINRAHVVMCAKTERQHGFVWLFKKCLCLYLSFGI